MCLNLEFRGCFARVVVINRVSHVEQNVSNYKIKYNKIGTFQKELQHSLLPRDNSRPTMRVLCILFL